MFNNLNWKSFKLILPKPISNRNSNFFQLMVFVWYAIDRKWKIIGTIVKRGMKYATNTKKFTFKILFGLLWLKLVFSQAFFGKNAFSMLSFSTILIRFSFRFSVSSLIEFLEMYKVFVFFYDIHRIFAENAISSRLNIPLKM